MRTGNVYTGALTTADISSDELAAKATHKAQQLQEQQQQLQAENKINKDDNNNNFNLERFTHVVHSEIKNR